MQAAYNQFVYFGFFQSLFLMTIYLVSPKTRSSINGYLVFLVGTLLISLSGRVLYISELFGQDFRMISFSEFSTLFFCSSLYLFARSSLFDKAFEYADLIHFIPGVFYVVFVIVYFMAPSDAVIVERINSGELARVISLFIGVGLLFNITYWILTVLEFKRFKDTLRNELSYSVKTQFFRNFLIAIGICLLAWTIIYFISFTGYEMIERESRQYIWLSIAFIILFITSYGLVAPEVFRNTALVNTRKYNQSKLTAQDLDRLKIQLEGLMEAQKPYLNKKLLKTELAEMMGISNPELARLLNERIGMNFFEFVNYYRVMEFVALAKTDKRKDLTFYGLAQEAGFNSKTTFNKAFKKLIGSSPSEYFGK